MSSLDTLTYSTLVSNNRSTNVKIHTRPSRADLTAASSASPGAGTSPTHPKRVSQCLHRNPSHHHHPSYRISLFCSFFLFWQFSSPKTPCFLVIGRAATNLDTQDSGIENTMCCLRYMSSNQEASRGSLVCTIIIVTFCPWLLQLSVPSTSRFRFVGFATLPTNNSKKKEGGLLWSIPDGQGVKRVIIRFILIPVNSF